MSRGLPVEAQVETVKDQFRMAHLISIEGNTQTNVVGAQTRQMGATFLYTDAPMTVTDTSTDVKFVYNVVLSIGSTTGTLSNRTAYLERFNEQVAVGFEVTAAGLPYESYSGAGYDTFPSGTTITAKGSITGPNTGYQYAYLDSTMTVTFSEASLEINGGQFLAFEGNYPYQANGFIIGLDGVKEGSNLNIGSLNLSVSSVNQTLITDMLENGHLNRKVTIKRVFLDSEGDLISGAVFQVYSGRIEGMSIKESGEDSMMELSVANHWADFKRESGRQTNNTSQQHHFSGDLSMEFAPQTGKKLIWGEVSTEQAIAFGF